MKKSIILITAIMLAMSACKKDDQQLTPPATTAQTATGLTLTQVQDWYNQQPQLSTQSNLQTFSLKKLPINWTKAESFGKYWLVTLPGQPTYQGVKQGYRKIAFLKDSTGLMTARILEIIPDVQYFQRKRKVSTKDFTGRVFVYDTQYHLLNGQIYSGGKQIGAIKPKDPNSPKLQTQMVQVSVSCDWYDSSYIDAEGTFTIHSEQICSYGIYDDGFYGDSGGGDAVLRQDPIGGGGGGSAPAETPPPVPELPSATAPAINPKNFMKCFGNIADAGATMTVTVYVQEPLPGTSFPYGTNGVGHTAIGLSKSGTGGTINQTVGFYPVSASDALGGASKLVDNGQITAYNTSITYTVNASQFNAIINYVANPPATYDLYNFNCTNFAIAACQTAGITLPSADTIVGLNGVGGLAHSATPAGLGTSIDNMKGQSNVNTNGGNMPASHGACN